MRATMILAAALGIAAATPDGAAAQQNPLSAHTRHMYAGVKAIILRSAEKMPEAKYGYQPTEVVRSFAQILGHVADSQYRYCSAVLGETNTARSIEKSRATKAELVAALKDAFAYCDRAYDGMTDSAGVGMVRLGIEMPKLGVLNINSIHSTEHYGNLVTYLRMNDIVPPTSEPGFGVAPPRP